MPRRDVVVIGGSSGATVPLKALLAGLPADFPAAVFVVLHIPTRGSGILATVTAAVSQLPVLQVKDGMPIRPGHIYLAVSDHHLLLMDGHVKLGRGPRENMVRPAIDPLFRSAALAYGPRVVGVVLSGLMNDGASGLEAIKRCGGVAVVQDPADALADEMPLSALGATPVDVTAPGARLAEVLSDLVREAPGWPSPPPADIRLEVEIAAVGRSDADALRRIADPSVMTCPTCHGVMSSVRCAKPLRYRCQVGHAMTAEIMARQQDDAVDEALRVALRVIEERAELVARMADDARKAGRASMTGTYDARAAEFRRYAETIRQAVIASMPDGPALDAGGGK